MFRKVVFAIFAFGLALPSASPTSVTLLHLRGIEDVHLVVQLDGVQDDTLYRQLLEELRCQLHQEIELHSRTLCRLGPTIIVRVDLGCGGPEGGAQVSLDFVDEVVVKRNSESARAVTYSSFARVASAEHTAAITEARNQIRRLFKEATIADREAVP